MTSLHRSLWQTLAEVMYMMPTYGWVLLLRTHVRMDWSLILFFLFFSWSRQTYVGVVTSRSLFHIFLSSQYRTTNSDIIHSPTSGPESQLVRPISRPKSCPTPSPRRWSRSLLRRADGAGQRCFWDISRARNDGRRREETTRASDLDSQSCG